jgi:hypothetical protein
VAGISLRYISHDRGLEFENCDLDSPNVGDIHLENITCQRSKVVLELRGFENAPIHDVISRNCTFDHIEQADILDHVRRFQRINVRENGKLVV